MDPALVPLLQQTIMVRRPSAAANDGWGPTFGIDAPVVCRVQPKVEVLRTIDRRDVVSSLVIYADGEVAAEVGWKVVFEGREWPILEISHHIDEAGRIDHTRLVV